MTSSKDIMKRFRNDFEYYSRKALTIRTIDKNRPFILNTSQKVLHAAIEEQLKQKNMVRAIVLKGRQQGCSTYVGGRFYHHTANNMSKRTYVMAHDSKTTGALFDMTLRFYEQTPIALKPSASRLSQNKLVFDKLGGEYSIGTAGSGDVGRGLTLNYVHGSEVAFWPDGERISKGLFGAVPFGRKTEIILESTANGMNNFFYAQWKESISGRSDFIPVFLPWYIHEENFRPPSADFELTKEEEELKKAFQLSDGQLYWRRMKIASLSSEGDNGEWGFKQEYPFTAIEAFQTSTTDSLINDSLILKARKNKVIDNDNEELVMGVDPARFGDDETAMIFRRGRRAFGLSSFRGKDNMQIAGIIANTLDKYMAIKKVFIDLGGGQGVVDRLCELGYSDRVVGINFGQKADKEDRYVNKRAEMWCEMRNWFQTEDVEIPDNDELHADIAVQSYSHQSDRKIQLTKKEVIKKKLKRSPDKGDALALTFNKAFDISQLL